MYRLGAWVAIALFTPAAAQAAVVEFSLVGSGSGSVGPGTFANAPVAFTATADAAAAEVTTSPDVVVRAYDLDTASFLIGSTQLAVTEPVAASVATTADDFTFVFFDFLEDDGFAADQIGVLMDTLGIATTFAFAGIVGDTDTVIQPPGIVTNGGALDFAALEFLTFVQSMDVDGIVPLPGAAWFGLTGLAALAAVCTRQRRRG